MKTPGSESLFYKVAGLRLDNLFKKETLTEAFSRELYEIFKDFFLIEWLNLSKSLGPFFSHNYK